MACDHGLDRLLLDEVGLEVEFLEAPPDWWRQVGGLPALAEVVDRRSGRSSVDVDVLLASEGGQISVLDCRAQLTSESGARKGGYGRRYEIGARTEGRSTKLGLFQ
jgi:hypothetical protein